MRDISNELIVATVHASTDNAGADIDSSSADIRDANAVSFTFEIGTITGTGSVTPSLEESVDDSVWTAVDILDQVGGSVLVSDTVQSIGYNGNQAFVRATTTVAGTITASTYGIVAVVGHLSLSPAV